MGMTAANMEGSPRSRRAVGRPRPHPRRCQVEHAHAHRPRPAAGGEAGHPDLQGPGGAADHLRRQHEEAPGLPHRGGRPGVSARGLPVGSGGVPAQAQNAPPAATAAPADLKPGAAAPERGRDPALSHRLRQRPSEEEEKPLAAVSSRPGAHQPRWGRFALHSPTLMMAVRGGTRDGLHSLLGSPCRALWSVGQGVAGKHHRQWEPGAGHPAKQRVPQSLFPALSYRSRPGFRPGALFLPARHRLCVLAYWTVFSAFTRP